jgi:hypothetical protein
MEADSGDLIFSQNENARLPMASTTKIMTALVTLERASLDERITIPAAAVGIEGSSIYLVENEILTVEELLYALMLQSANDAAVALALAVAGSVDAFALLMNEKASELGLTDSHFVNPHGLDADEHYTTARELALITRAAMENPTFRRICGTERRSIPMQGVEGKRLLLNHNKMLRTYDGGSLYHELARASFAKHRGATINAIYYNNKADSAAITINSIVNELINNPAPNYHKLAHQLHHFKHDARAINLQGVIDYRRHRLHAAEKAFEKAAAMGDEQAAVNLMILQNEE